MVSWFYFNVFEFTMDTFSKNADELLNIIAI